MDKINIEQVINKWFDMKYQTYDKLEHEDSIYLYYVGQEYAEIRVDVKYKFIDYQWKIYYEFSEMISIQRNVFDMVMNKWVEDTFGLKGFTPTAIFGLRPLMLKIPKINN